MEDAILYHGMRLLGMEWVGMGWQAAAAADEADNDAAAKV